jgi:hypothetical protein
VAWSTPVDYYCERTDPSFWAEPVNALTNAAFLVAACAAFIEWRRRGTLDVPVLLLIAVTASIGIGSFLFHTIATRGAVLFDTIPIAGFVYGYLLLALRRFLGLRVLPAIGIVLAFVLVTQAASIAVPEQTLNGSVDYLPSLVGLAVVGFLLRATPHGRLIMGAAGVFALSLAFRTIDMRVCPAFPLGTHFLWHVLNAGVLYLMLRAAILGRARA